MWLLLSVGLPLCAALQVPDLGARRTPQLGRVTSAAPVFDPLNLKHAEAPALPSAYAMLGIGASALAASQPEAAFAKGGEYGIFEGRIISLAHPTVMAVCYAATAWAAFTGFQWRRLREIGNQITELKAEQAGPKKQLDKLLEGETNPGLSAQVAAFQTQIDELTLTRKDLAGSNLRDKHYQVGSVILGLGTSFAIEGPVNTFLRAQKLFPGPHLYAGAGVVVCWALAASLVPLMQKGKDSARSAHIALNAVAIFLFSWQLATGWEIVQKVLQFTKFP